MDADGDLTVSYDGYGPDVSEADIDRLIKTTLIYQQTAYYGQDLSFSVTTPGLFQLVLDGTTTANINYDPTNLNLSDRVGHSNGVAEDRTEHDGHVRLE